MRSVTLSWGQDETRGRRSIISLMLEMSICHRHQHGSGLGSAWCPQECPPSPLQPALLEWVATIPARSRRAADLSPLTSHLSASLASLASSLMSVMWLLGKTLVLAFLGFVLHPQSLPVNASPAPVRQILSVFPSSLLDGVLALGMILADRARVR